jgi:hypothetical protein
LVGVVAQIIHSLRVGIALPEVSVGEIGIAQAALSFRSSGEQKAQSCAMDFVNYLE